MTPDPIFDREQMDAAPVSLYDRPPVTSSKENLMRNLLAALSSCVLLVSFFAALHARAADAKPDEEGFIRDWLMLAPASIPESGGADEGDKKEIADEGALQPTGGEKQKTGDKEIPC